MPIGDQEFANGSVTASHLKERYDDLIKEAILKARPALEVVRADEIAMPGTITSDIITRLMHSEFVVADVTYPNPNVFYELGLRHACRTGTVIIRDEDGPETPFDIAHLRHIKYKNSPTGLKALSGQLKTWFEHFSAHQELPDNQFQEMAKLTSYRFPDYAPADDANPEKALIAVMQQPELLDLLIRQSEGEQVDTGELLRTFAAHPEVAQVFIKAFVDTSELSSPSATKVLPTSAKTQRKRPSRKKKSR